MNHDLTDRFQVHAIWEENKNRHALRSPNLTPSSTMIKMHRETVRVHRTVVARKWTCAAGTDRDQGADEQIRSVLFFLQKQTRKEALFAVQL